MDLHNLFRFLALRMENHAQGEIRQYATVIGEKIVVEWCPMARSAFVDYCLEARTCSRIEWNHLRSILSGEPKEATDIAANAGFLKRSKVRLMRNCEREEIEAKLRDLGVQPPWLDIHLG